MTEKNENSFFEVGKLYRLKSSITWTDWEPDFRFKEQESKRGDIFLYLGETDLIKPKYTKDTKVGYFLLADGNFSCFQLNSPLARQPKMYFSKVRSYEL